MASTIEDEDSLSVYMTYVDPNMGERSSTNEEGAEALLLSGAGEIEN
jgi:hypothetical protein